MSKPTIVTVVVMAFIAVLLYFFWPNFGAIRFKNYSAAEFTQQLMPLALVALFIERSLEVVVTAWRGGDAETKQLAVDNAAAEAKADTSKLPALATAKTALTNYKSETRQIAFPAALILGIIISALGIRGLGTLLDTTVFAALPGPQQRGFTIVDVLLTGSLLGGGSDFVHKVITTFTDLLDATKK
jgi:hypothetical protein